MVEVGALWQHDGNPKRPYALLTTGNISDSYVNSGRLVTYPSLVAAAAKELAGKIRLEVETTENLVMVGQMKGSVTLASRIAEELDCAFIWTNKSADQPDKEMEIDTRFNLSRFENHHFVVIEDVLTTGDTSLRTIKSLGKLGISLLPIIPCLVSWNPEKEINGYKILPCLSLTMNVWGEGKNPYTENGQELVDPVRPKGAHSQLLYDS